MSNLEEKESDSRKVFKPGHPMHIETHTPKQSKQIRIGLQIM